LRRFVSATQTDRRLVAVSGKGKGKQSKSAVAPKETASAAASAQMVALQAAFTQERQALLAKVAALEAQVAMQQTLLTSLQQQLASAASTTSSSTTTTSNTSNTSNTSTKSPKVNRKLALEPDTAAPATAASTGVLDVPVVVASTSVVTAPAPLITVTASVPAVHEADASASPKMSVRKARPGDGASPTPGSPVKDAIAASREKSSTVGGLDYSARRAAREAEREEERKRREEERLAREKAEADDLAARAEQREKRRLERLRKPSDDESRTGSQSPAIDTGTAAPAAAPAAPTGAAAAAAAAGALDASGILVDVPPTSVKLVFGRSAAQVELDIKPDDTIGSLRRRLFDEKLVPSEWAAQRVGGGGYTQSDVLIGKLTDTKFEPHPSRRTMQELRYELNNDNKLVVHVRPSIPLLPAGVRAPDLLLRMRQVLSDSATSIDAKAADSLAKRVARRAGSSVGSAPGSHRAAERSKWLPVSDVLPFAEVAIKWEWSVVAEAWQHSIVLVSVDARPFSEGAMRQAYYCRVLSDGERGYVAKFAKNEREPRRTYFEDVRMQTIASDLAKRFNDARPPKTVDVVCASVLEFPYRGSGSGEGDDVDVRRVCGLEAAIEDVSVDTPFRKYNNNTGWKTDEGVRNTPQAFSHFTYEATQKQMIVVDIQGVALVNGDVYTDPQIHVVGGVGFGVGNHGKAGIDAFLATHTCNAVCRHLNLPTVTAQANAVTSAVISESGKDNAGATVPKPILSL
jgi:hypothetical protein